MSITERRDYTVLRSYLMREEAEVVAGALRGDGIDAFIGNTNHAYVEWLLVPALGGLQVLVPASRLMDARRALNARLAGASPFEAEDAVKRGVGWKGRSMLALMILPWLAWLLTLGVTLPTLGG